MAERDRVKGFFVGTGSDPLGAAVELSVDGEEAVLRIDPMAQRGALAPLVSRNRAVIHYQREAIARLRAESYRSRSVTPALKAKRKPGIRGEWIECPACHAQRSDDCETCYGRGAIWQSS